MFQHARSDPHHVIHLIGFSHVTFVCNLINMCTSNIKMIIDVYCSYIALKIMLVMG